jgi:hypothetical protein
MINSQSLSYETKLFGIWKNKTDAKTIVLVFHPNLKFTETSFSNNTVSRYLGSYKILFPFSENQRKIFLSYSDGTKKGLKFKYISASPDMIKISDTLYTNFPSSLKTSYYTGKWKIKLSDKVLIYTLTSDYKAVENIIPENGFPEKQHGSFSIEAESSQTSGKYLIILRFGNYTRKTLYFYQSGKNLQFKLALDIYGKKVFNKVISRTIYTYNGNLF